MEEAWMPPGVFGPYTSPYLFCLEAKEQGLKHKFYRGYVLPESMDLGPLDPVNQALAPKKIQLSLVNRQGHVWLDIETESLDKDLEVLKTQVPQMEQLEFKALYKVFLFWDASCVHGARVSQVIRTEQGLPLRYETRCLHLDIDQDLLRKLYPTQDFGFLSGCKPYVLKVRG